MNDLRITRWLQAAALSQIVIALMTIAHWIVERSR